MGMNLRLPLVLTVVTGAAAVAVFRSQHAAPSPALPFEAASETGVAAPPPRAAMRVRAAQIVVYVAGEVRRRGIYELPASARASDAVRAAGGATANADLVAVNLAEPLNDGDEVAVPALGDDAPAAGTHSRKRAHHRRHHKKKHHHRATAETVASDTADGSDAPPPNVVNLNRADESELESLPGIGPALAERIVEFREQTGPYASADDLLDVSGVTQSKLDAIAPYVSTGN
jgi:competence protein ComEA